jgi:monothiol glutaredoxin
MMVRWSSSDSHEDFMPKVKSEGKDVHDLIDQEVKGNKVFLYMKGYPYAPQCGFSAQVVAILDKVGVQYSSRNVLEDQQVREGIKKYSNWPTIPQLYVNGEFVGGCDIVTAMFKSGELEELVKEDKQ